VADSNGVKELTDAKGLTSIFDIHFVKVKTENAVNGPVCDIRFVNLEYIHPLPTTNGIPSHQPYTRR